MTHRVMEKKFFVQISTGNIFEARVFLTCGHYQRGSDWKNVLGWTIVPLKLWKNYYANFDSLDDAYTYALDIVTIRYNRLCKELEEEKKIYDEISSRCKAIPDKVDC